MQYYPLVKKWKKVKSCIDDEALTTLEKDFNRYTFGRRKQEFKKGMYPRQFESCDWDIGRRGRHPEYWNYVKHAACHWIVNFTLVLANKVEPKKDWRIITSQKHSTVWDGKNTLFDFNFYALKIDADKAFSLANKKELKPGKKLIVYHATND